MQLICMLRKMKTITFAKELDKVSKNGNQRENPFEKKSIFLQNHKIVTLYNKRLLEILRSLLLCLYSLGQRRSARCAGGDQRRAKSATQRDAQPSDLSQSEPVGCAKNREFHRGLIHLPIYIHTSYSGPDVVEPPGPFRNPPGVVASECRRW